MTATLRKVENLLTIPISRDFAFSDESEKPTLAPRLIRELRDSPPTTPDEWGFVLRNQIWVLFYPEGGEHRTLAEEEPDEHHQWINAFRLINPREEFIADWESDLKRHLKELFQADEFTEQKQDILYRITAT